MLTMARCMILTVSDLLLQNLLSKFMFVLTFSKKDKKGFQADFQFIAYRFCTEKTDKAWLNSSMRILFPHERFSKRRARVRLLFCFNRSRKYW